MCGPAIVGIAVDLEAAVLLDGHSCVATDASKPGQRMNLVEELQPGWRGDMNTHATGSSQPKPCTAQARGPISIPQVCAGTSARQGCVLQEV
eukprot:4667202-Amphidinium_carterae.1